MPVGQGVIGVKPADTQALKEAEKTMAKPQVTQTSGANHDAETAVPRKSSGKVTNDALPPGTRSAFVGHLVPRLLERLGRRDNPWAFQSNAKAAAEVAELWADVFPRVPLNYTFNTETPLFKLVRVDCQTVHVR